MSKRKKNKFPKGTQGHHRRSGSSRASEVVMHYFIVGFLVVAFLFGWMKAATCTKR
jgi:hypothetical protein